MYRSPRLVEYVHGTELRVYYDPVWTDVIHVSVRDSTGAFTYVGPAWAYTGHEDTPEAFAFRAEEDAWIAKMGEEDAARREVAAREDRIGVAIEQGRHMADSLIGNLPPSRPAKLLLGPAKQTNDENGIGDAETKSNEDQGHGSDTIIVNPFF
jgi:hypothetical protein